MQMQNNDDAKKSYNKAIIDIDWWQGIINNYDGVTFTIAHMPETFEQPK